MVAPRDVNGPYAESIVNAIENAAYSPTNCDADFEIITTDSKQKGAIP